jgi:hypothetical protein
VPPAERINEASVQLAARAALAQGVEYFRQQAKEDPDGWLVPPARLQQVLDWKEVDVRYTMRKVTIPKYEYETYETYERVPGASATDAAVMQKVTRKRIKRQIGTEEIEDKFLDPQGTLVEKRRQAVYGPGGPDLWRAGYFGHNGLVLYALMSMMVPAAKAWTLATSAAAAKALRMLRSLVMLSSLLSSFAGHGPGWLASF